MTNHAKVPAGRAFAVEKLEVFWIAIEFLELCDSLRDGLWRGHSGLWRQLQRASASVIANMGEATSSLTHPDRRRYFEYSYRSAGECAALVIAYSSLHALTDADVARARQLLHRIQMMLIRLIQRSR